MNGLVKLTFAVNAALAVMIAFGILFESGYTRLPPRPQAVDASSVVFAIFLYLAWNASVFAGLLIKNRGHE